MAMAKLVILRGNSGSGKTTVAKGLQRKFGRNTLLISQDMVRREMLIAEDGENTTAIPLMQELLVYGRKHSEVSILEGIMYADWYRPLFECAIREFGDEIYAYYFDLPFEETVRRHQSRSKSQEFGEERMREWWREKDYMRLISEHIITAESTAEESIDLIYQQVFS